MKRSIMAALAAGILFAACGQPAEEKIEITLELAQQYLSEGNYQEAIEAFTALIEIDPKNEILYMGRADAYTYLEQYPEAVNDYSTVVSLNDENVEAYIYRGVLDLVQGDTDAGEEDLQYVTALTAEEGNDSAYDILISYLERLEIELEKEDSMEGAARLIYVLPDGSHLVILKLEGQPFGIVVAGADEEIPEDIGENLLTAFVWKNSNQEFADLVDMLEFRSGGTVHGIFGENEQDRAYMAVDGNIYYIASGEAGIEPGSSWDPQGYYYDYPEPNVMVTRSYTEFICDYYPHEGKTYLYVAATSFGGGFLFEPDFSGK